MLVACPHVGEPHPDTKHVIDRYERGVYVSLDHDPDYGYAKMLLQLWTTGETFAIVEQDVVPTPSLLREIARCPEPYCAAPYAWTTTVGPALGCTKFSSLLVRSYPDAMEIAAKLPSNFGEPGHYQQLDVRLMQTVLRDLYGLQPHCHAPVQHRNQRKHLLEGAAVTTTVDGRSYLPAELVEQVAAEAAAQRLQSIPPE